MTKCYVDDYEITFQHEHFIILTVHINGGDVISITSGPLFM